METVNFNSVFFFFFCFKEMSLNCSFFSLFLSCLVLSWCHWGSQSTSVCSCWGVFPKRRSLWWATSLHRWINVSTAPQAQGLHGKDCSVQRRCYIYFCNLRFMSKWTLRCLLFQVGCGAIGCEMLKNFALLGVGLAKSSGEVVSSSMFGCISLWLFNNWISGTYLVKPCPLHLSILRCASQTQTLSKSPTSIGSFSSDHIIYRWREVHLIILYLFSLILFTYHFST